MYKKSFLHLGLGKNNYEIKVVKAKICKSIQELVLKPLYTALISTFGNF